jgi:site-specific DNA recombinase
MWMGGVVPLGYSCVDRLLVINRPEANVVRKIFRQYLRLGCVERLKNYLDRAQILSKIRTSNAGRKSGGTSFSRGALYHLLSNRVFIGEIVHRKQNYPGQHQAIIQRQLWDRVAARLKANNQAHRTMKSQSSPSLLSGIIFDAKGVRLTPTHAVKHGKRYRYYTSQAAIKLTSNRAEVTRFPAHEIEGLVTAQIHLLLGSADKFTSGISKQSPDKDVAAERATEFVQSWPKLETSAQLEFMRKVLRRVVVGQTAIWLEVDRTKLVETLLGRKSEFGTAVRRNQPDLIKLTTDFQPQRRRGELYLVTPKSPHSDRTPSPGLVKAVARARDWYEQIVKGEVRNVAEIARKTGMPSCDIKYALKFAILSPQITEAILAGKHPPNLTLRELRNNISIDWKQQQERILQLQ